MKKDLIIISSIVIVLLIVLGLVLQYTNPKKIDVNPLINTSNITHDATYNISGQKVTLINGVSEVEAAPGSASKITTKFFGNEVKHDFNGDGREDSAFILTQETGGSGAFYYVVARLNTINGPVGSEGVLLGDRIAPQTTEMDKGNIIVVNYAERKPGESFTVQPSVGKSIWLLLDPKTMQLGEVTKNFEGEADPDRMTLDMKTWVWVNTTYNEVETVGPRFQNKFTLTFKKDNIFSATTDCNGVGGEYMAVNNKLTFSGMRSTLMFCENSQESDFTKMLSETESYSFTSKGELILNLKSNKGAVLLK